MEKKLLYIFAAFILFFATLPAWAAEVGKPAPDFSATDIDGKSFKLSDHKGEIVVLEWTNHDCPFVKKHYSAGNMQKTQTEAKTKGAKWITINSSAPGMQGHLTSETAHSILEAADAHPDAKILDESGAIGKLYNAQTTPHMYVIDKEGTLVYAGAIDDQPTPDPGTIPNAKNYVLAAIDDLVAGNPVATAQTQPYGCGVKYAH